ncbi:Y-family DNA polymerase [Maritalea porphyrae]|uniref:Y-family DNA polymerase n=1 Tax=Maritalea porphyrae TaxID=880732 RepID=UPI0022B02560|nr:DNA polymerase Y family protein [Maritalea porphyrae]MCZ4272377.1 DNA polymerase Y family protein [Maritalea porphyrae]
MKHRRILCLWFPQLPIENLRLMWRQTHPANQRADTVSPAKGNQKAKPQKKPLALLEQTPKGIKIFAANPAANHAGVRTGMRLADAKAVCHNLETLHHDPKADQKLLMRRTAWLLRFSPIVVPHLPDTIFLDITGCDHLFGGEKQMLNQIHTQLQKLGHSTRLGLGDTIGAAWALTKYEKNNKTILPADNPHQGLAFLPVHALRLTPEQADALFQLGLKTIGQLFDLPRAALTRRFPDPDQGEAVLKRLDQAVGRYEEPLTAPEHQPDFRFTAAPVDPFIDLPNIERSFYELLDQLFALLDKLQQGVLHLRLDCFFGDGKIKSFPIRLAQPSRSKPHIKRLFDEKLITIDPGFGIDALVLNANKIDQLPAQQLQLDAHHESARQDENLSPLLDRVANRLGPGAVYRLAPFESHLPEQSQKAVHPLKPEAWENWPSNLRRPATLFAHPEPIEVIAQIPEGPPIKFLWRKVLRHITYAQGPERILPEWWADLADRLRVRDYFEVEDHKGLRYWVFREGHYDDPMEKGAPTWRLHGLFA